MPLTSFTRRRFLKYAGAAVLGIAGTGLAATTYAYNVEPFWVEVVERPLPIAHLPQELVGRTLVQISDLHTGPADRDYLRSALHRVSEMRPDLVVVTGDFTDHALDGEIEEVGRLFDEFRMGRLGTFGILGNHDYVKRIRCMKQAERAVKRLSEAGVDILRNERRTVAGLQLIGLDDYWSPNYNPGPVLASRDRNAATLVLCHNPDVADQPVWSGYRGWILAGHTHGGQMMAPLVGPPYLPVQNKRYIAGEYDAPEGRRLYINRGLGYGVRARLCARPEITVFTLTRGQAQIPPG